MKDKNKKSLLNKKSEIVSTSNHIIMHKKKFLVNKKMEALNWHPHVHICIYMKTCYEPCLDNIWIKWQFKTSSDIKYLITPKRFAV
jgi:hypothetical protein